MGFPAIELQCTFKGYGKVSIPNRDLWVFRLVVLVVS